MLPVCMCLFCVRHLKFWTSWHIFKRWVYHYWNYRQCRRVIYLCICSNIVGYFLLDKISNLFSPYRKWLLVQLLASCISAINILGIWWQCRKVEVARMCKLSISWGADIQISLCEPRWSLWIYESMVKRRNIFRVSRRLPDAKSSLFRILMSILRSLLIRGSQSSFCISR